MKGLTGVILWLVTANLLAAGIGLNPTGIDMGSNPISNLAEPLIPSDAATKSYVDSNAEARIPIDTAGFVIDSPGSYYLTGDLEAIGTSGIDVNATYVTIDMMGYSVVGDGSAKFGINIGINRSEITIRNGRIRGFGKSGIYGPGSNNRIRIENVFVSFNGSAGTDSEIYSGIYLSHEIVISNCSVEGNGYNGISVGERSRVTNSSVMSNSNTGIVTNGEGFVAENSVGRNGNVGIQITSGAVVNNLVTANGDDGIQALASTTITGNTSQKNPGNGIKATDSSIVGNMIYDNNTSDGAFLAGIYAGGYSRVSGNTIIRNSQNNIYVKSHGHVIIENNYIASSAYGIRFGSSVGSAYRDNAFTFHTTSTTFNVGTNVDDGGNLVY